VDGLSFANGSGIMVLDDLDSDDAPMYGKVNFLLKNDLKFAASPIFKGQIVTSRIQDLLNNKTAFQIYTNEGFKVDGVDNIIKSIPIDIYADKDHHTLQLGNTFFVTANIKAPYTDLEVGSSSIKLDSTVYYNGFRVKDGYHSSSRDAISLIGCAVVNNLTKQANDFMLLYVPEEAGSDDSGTVVKDAILTSWRIMKYEAF
jgi:hypothetical protein